MVENRNRRRPVSYGKTEAEKAEIIEQQQREAAFRGQLRNPRELARLNREGSLHIVQLVADIFVVAVRSADNRIKPGMLTTLTRREATSLSRRLARVAS